MRTRRGSTLLELIATLAIMAIVAAVVTVAARGSVQPANAQSALATARSRALSAATPVTVTVALDGRAIMVTMLPDGGVVADSGIALDRLSGSRRNARR